MLRRNCRALGEHCLGSLREEANRYGRPSILAAQIERLKESLADGEKHRKKASEDKVEVCRKFEVGREALQEKQKSIL